MVLRGTVGEITDPCVELRFSWEVKNFFSMSGAEGDCYNSPNFQCFNRRFYVQLYPNGDSRYNAEGWISLYLVLGESSPPIQIECILGLKTAKEDTEQRGWIINDFRGDFTSAGWTKAMKRSDLLLRRKELAPSDVLTFTFTMKKCGPQPLGETTEVAVQTDENVGGLGGNEGRQHPEITGLLTLSRNLKDLYVAGKECDVTLKVKDQKFPAHKLILGARTPVLAAMFSHNMAESETGVVCMEDCQPEAFKVFLTFLYSGVAENLTGENTTQVYYIADKYDLPDLKQECVQCLLSTMAVDSICSILALAERHGEELLLEKATEYFLKHCREIFATDGWKQFMVENTTLANELIIRTVENISGAK